MITLAVALIVLMIAVPNLNKIMQNHRAVTITNAMVSSLSLARSEAVMRGMPVSICPAADQNFNACGNDWSQGWIIFVNPDGNAIFANNAFEPLIRVKQITGNGTRIVNTFYSSLITYNSMGFADIGTNNIQFTLSTKGCTDTNARSVTILGTGKVVVAREQCKTYG